MPGIIDITTILVVAVMTELPVFVLSLRSGCVIIKKKLGDIYDKDTRFKGKTE